MTKKILIVDDDEGILDALQIMLENAGYTVDVMLSGEDLRHLNPTNLPDLILLDVLLSGMDGRLLCKELKQSVITKRIPIVMLSAAPDIAKSIKEAHADDFLPKPFDMDDLLKIIKKHLKS